MEKNKDRIDEYYNDIKNELKKIQDAIKPISELLLEINGEVVKIKRDIGLSNNASQ